jgi:acetyl esterase/lipase
VPQATDRLSRECCRVMVDPNTDPAGVTGDIVNTYGTAQPRSLISKSCARTSSGLPPTYISVGGLDLFFEENMTYGDRLSRAGAPVEFHLYPRAYHGFYRATNTRVTRQAEHDTREVLRRFLHG